MSHKPLLLMEVGIRMGKRSEGRGFTIMKVYNSEAAPNGRNIKSG